MQGQSRAERRRSRREEGKVSKAEWGTLEEFARLKIQGWIQDLLNEEITELLGREKSARREAVDAPPGYRNGYGKPRRLTMSSGTITVCRPRVRELEERFESRVLPLFVKRTEQLADVLPCNSGASIPWRRIVSAPFFTTGLRTLPWTAAVSNTLVR